MNTTPPTLPTIIEWYQTLPKGAREKLSLQHLHTLAKMIRALSQPLPDAPIVSGEGS